SCRGHRKVGSEIGLHFVDSRQHGPRHAVLDRGRLVDRKQEQGNTVEVKRPGGGGRAGDRRGERTLLSRGQLWGNRDVSRALRGGRGRRGGSCGGGRGLSAFAGL